MLQTLAEEAVSEEENLTTALRITNDLEAQETAFAFWVEVARGSTRRNLQRQLFRKTHPCSRPIRRGCCRAPRRTRNGRTNSFARR